MYDRLLQGDHQSSVFRGRTVSLASAEDDRCRDPGDQHQVGVQRDGLASLQSPSKVFFSGSENCVVKCSSAWLKHTGGTFQPAILGTWEKLFAGLCIC